MRRAVVLAVLCSLAAAGATRSAAVRVWEGVLELPTYAEGPANLNAPFDLFTSGRFNYPYPLRDALTDRRAPIAWRTLHLENEYLRLTVLPDLGGHIYSCVDKRTGAEMFYANKTIKKALIGYRGAWAAFGVEFNFPVSHNWMSMSPVDFATATHPDGSASLVVGNVDQVYRSQWRVELRLAPGRAVLEQKVDLYNRSDVRHRYYWWSNAAVQAWEDSQLVYPTELMATHGFTSVEPWPIDRKGRDLSVIRNQTDGPVSLFTYLTREGFVGVYHPRTKSGTVHVADPAELPVHKVWSWGYDREAAAWREALSDDDSGYVELQAGLFRNQETYGFLEPQENVQFTEYWLPVRDIGGITRATGDAVLHVTRGAAGGVAIALEVTRDVPGAAIRFTRGDRSDTVTADLSPTEIWRGDRSDTGGPWSITLTDRAGRVLLRHESDRRDLTPASDVTLGPRAAAERAPSSSAAGALEAGTTLELEGRRLSALDAYRTALEAHPNDAGLLEAAGRLALSLGWVEAQRTLGGTRDALDWLEAAHKRNTTDAELGYYFGLALAAAERPRDARPHLEAAARFRATRTAALLALAKVLASDEQNDAALAAVQRAVADAPRASAVGAIEVSLLRRMGRPEQALTRARHWVAVDPASSVLRFELVRLGQQDDVLWAHLAADANRVLDVVDHYLAMGAYADALLLLERRYPDVAEPRREPGAVSPNDSPLVAYYRGYARGRAGGNPGPDFTAARGLPTAYVFPNRRSSYAVLQAALTANRDDTTARFLLGSLYLASGLVQPASSSWQQVRRAGAAIPTLHRNLGLLLLHSDARSDARAVLEEGTAADPANVEVYLALDGVLSAENAAPSDRAAALQWYPQPDRMPSAMVFKLALALAEQGQHAAAERLFHDRFFPREEGGTSVRAVYTQVRLTSARAAADRGDCGAARAMLDALPSEQPTLAFTAGGMADALLPAPAAYQVADVDAACGRRDRARQTWERLARPLETGGSPLAIAIADAARDRVARPRTTRDRQRLQAAIETAARVLESSGTNSPGTMELARAWLLTAVGQHQEARRALAQVFRHPDRNLSHAHARTLLRVSPAEVR